MRSIVKPSGKAIKPDKMFFFFLSSVIRRLRAGDEAHTQLQAEERVLVLHVVFGDSAHTPFSTAAMMSVADFGF